MVLQYIFIAVFAGLAIWFLVRKIRNTFSQSGCSGGCGCAKSEISKDKV